jgi:hypothetical protein
VGTTFTTPYSAAVVDIRRHKNHLQHIPQCGPRRQRTRRLESWLTFQWPMREEPHHRAQHRHSDRSSTTPQRAAHLPHPSSQHLPPVHVSARKHSSLRPLPPNSEPCLRLRRILPRAHQHNPSVRRPTQMQRRRERSRSPAWLTSRVLPSMSRAHFPRRAHYRDASGEILQTLAHNMRLAKCLSQISSKWLPDY